MLAGHHPSEFGMKNIALYKFHFEEAFDSIHRISPRKSWKIWNTIKDQYNHTSNT